VPKVASSSVKMAMALMTGRIDDDAQAINVHDPSFMAHLGLTSLNSYLATEDNRTWSQQPRKFVIVRHPLQ